MRNAMRAGVLIGSLAWMLCACAQESDLPASQRPFLYVIDYSANHIGNEKWLGAAAHCRPDLLHLGKDVPFMHNWGPVAGWGGENQFCGSTPEERTAYQRRLSPDEVKQRIETITKMVGGLHGRGVAEVMPYVCAMTIAGDWERRTGLWALYDHWEEYAAFGLGPKPPDDPRDWLARTGDGLLLGYYASPEKTYPPYGTERRCAACLYHPAWRQYMKAVMELIAKCGYDGVFPDNSCMFLCECPRCQGKFREFLKSRYGREDRRRLFGSEDLNEVRLLSGDGTLLSAECKRFWCAGIADFMAHLKRSGEAVRPGFKVFPNAGAARWVEHAVPQCDLVMYELHGKEGMGSFPGVVSRNIVENIHVESYISNEFEHKFTRAVGARVRAVGLVMAGGEAAARATADCLWLPLAEACAYGGGGSASGLRMTADPAQSAPTVAYRDFLHRWGDLYEGYRPWAQVGIATFSDQDFYEHLGWLSHGRHLMCARETATQLAEGHYLTDFVVQRRFTPECLRRFKAVVLCLVQYMDQKEIEVARSYAEGGGLLLLVGDNGIRDYRAETRGARPFADMEDGEALAVCPEARVKAVGKGKAAFFRTAPRQDELAKTITALLPGEAPIFAGGSAQRGRRIHFEATARWEAGRSRIVLHAINYNVRLGKNPPPTEPIEGLRVSAGLPSGGRVKAVWSVAPDAVERQEAPFMQQGERVEFVIPSFRFYRAVAIDLE